ncbi:MAG TPA: hypothetical protein VFT51_08700 [Bacillales bacterium]|nr:hypothetical protein [Bacillales bacterium]
MYVIKGANDLNGRRKDFLIQGQQITYISNELDKLKHVDMNCHGFSIEPGMVAVDFSILHLRQFSGFKKKIIHWQKLGCTTTLVVCPVERERNLGQQLKQARHQMINSSIDYVIGISFPMSRLTPEIVRLCRREKVPFINATMEDEKDLEAVTWAWIRDSLFAYRLAITPDWRGLNLSNKQMGKLKEQWREIARTNDIPTIVDFPEEERALANPILRKIGISPFKGELRPGCDLDYNLYENASLADGSDHDYDRDSHPDIVVLRGEIMKAGKTVYYRPGFGKEISIRVPGYLTTYTV